MASSKKSKGKSKTNSRKTEDETKAAAQMESNWDENTKRIVLHVSKEHEDVITEASLLAGFRDVSKYIIQVTLADAQRVMRDNKILTLSREDSVLFMKVLQNPPMVNEKLRKAFTEFSESLGW